MKLKNLLLSTLGIIIIAFAVALIAATKFGLDPWGVLFNSFAILWNYFLPNNMHITYGTSITIVSIFSVTIASFILKERWNYLSVIAGIILGQFVNLFMLFLVYLPLDNFFAKTVSIFVAMFILGLGISLTIEFPFFMSPVDYFSLAIDKLTPFNYGITRVVCDTSATTLGVIVTLLVTHDIMKAQVGLGTILMFALGGIIVNYCLTILKKFLHR